MIALKLKLIGLLTLLVSLLAQLHAVPPKPHLLGSSFIPSAPTNATYSSSTYLGGGHIICKKPIIVAQSCFPNAGYIAWNSYKDNTTTTLTFELYNSGNVTQVASSSFCAVGGAVCTVQGITVAASGNVTIPDCNKVATSSSCH